MTARARRLARLGAGLLGLLALAAVGADLLAPYRPDERAGRPFAPPSGAHPLGTNDVGHDLLTELIHGARVSLLVGLVAAAAATVLGAGVGLAAGYARGRLDATLMRLVDVVLALPVVPLTLVIGVFAGPGLRTQMLVIASVIWAGVARELRAQVLSLRERDHIQALWVMGARFGYLLPRHLAPAVAPLMVPQFVLATKQAILLEASLAFLGLGAPTAKSWGAMLSLAHARGAFLTDAWLWWVLPPGLAIAATVLGFALLGFALEERTRPTLRDTPPSARPSRSDERTVRRGDGDEHAPLVLDGLSVAYGGTAVLCGVTLSVHAGELVGLVGPSGGGKSTVAAAAAALLPAAARVRAGRVLLDGRDLATLGPSQLRGVRGERVGLVPQEAMSALDPVRTVGRQLVDAATAHRALPRPARRARARELLELVGLEPALVDSYPHQLSGGMRQRAVIALALASGPAVLVADEPTSGLDVLLAAEVLALLDRLRRELGVALLVVSHDVPAIETVADRIVRLRGGRITEGERSHA